ncbi:MAG: FtsX-like permease family protein [Rhodoblastus sp.]
MCFGALAAFAAMIGLVYALSSEKQIALIAIAAVALSAIVLRVVGWAVAHGAALGANVRNLPARLALGNIRRPGAVTRPVVTSLGLGLTLLVVIVAVDGNVRRQLSSGDPGRTPDYFFADVQSAQADAFRKMLTSRRPDAAIEQVPMLRGRIVRVGTRRAEDVKADQNSAWVLDGDRGVTYAASPPPGSKVTAGKWWPADYKGPPLVSLDGDIARGLGLSLDDEIAVNVMGREIVARIVNLREVDWRSFGINFVLVFTPSTFAGAPHTELISMTVPPGTSAASGSLVSEISRAYPTVVTLAVREALQQALALTEKLSTAIRAASSVTLVTALLTLGGALAAGQRARLYDAVVLRMLGATRRRLILAYLLEFLLLGAATSIFALAAGAIAAQQIVTRLMKLDFVLDWPALASIVALGCLTTIALGLAATWRLLGAKPARVLREL